eukprot:7657760-Alexandrium_andersonii.AAC.1
MFSPVRPAQWGFGWRIPSFTISREASPVETNKLGTRRQSPQFAGRAGENIPSCSVRDRNRNENKCCGA